MFRKNIMQILMEGFIIKEFHIIQRLLLAGIRSPREKKINDCHIFLIFLFAATLFGYSCAHSPPPARPQSIVAVPGVDLKSVHRRLEISGFSPGPYNEEDVSWLQPPIMRFQHFARLEVNGILDVGTWRKLQQLYDPKVPGEKQKASGEPTVSDLNSGQDKLIKIISPSSPISSHFPLRKNDKAYAFELSQCSDISGDWVLFFEGTVMEIKNDFFSLRLEKRFAYRNRSKEEGIDGTDWWCIPRKRHCYSQVKFSDWGGKFRQEQIVVFKGTDVSNAENGLINVLTEWLERQCNR
jgi:hypothetical protein